MSLWTHPAQVHNILPIKLRIILIGYTLKLVKQMPVKHSKVPTHLMPFMVAPIWWGCCATKSPFVHSSRSGNFFVQYITQITGCRLFFPVTTITLLLLGNLLGYCLEIYLVMTYFCMVFSWNFMHLQRYFFWSSFAVIILSATLYNNCC